jgi:N-acetylmuramoyl-L-alanine amidase
MPAPGKSTTRKSEPPGSLARAALRIISAMLAAVRNSLPSIAFLWVVALSWLVPLAETAGRFPQDQSQPAAPTPATVPSGPVIVLDPAHGGTDTGARGEGGHAEKDVVLALARTVRAQLEHQGYRVLMTRDDDSNPSYDDRAAVADAHRDAIFISLHIASTGPPGTARAYWDRLSSTPPQPSARATPPLRPLAPQATNTLVVWDQAQRPYLETSHHLADLIQIQLAQSFSGSPTASTAAAVRTLRSVMAPAVAIEISNISVPPDTLTGSGGPLSAAIARGISALRSSGVVGAR